LQVLAGIFGFVMASANLFQAIRIFRRKSAKDLSLITFLLFLIGSIIWTLYGFEVKDPAIIWPNAFGTITITTVLIGWVMYR